MAPVSQADAIMTVCHQWHSELLALGTPPEKCVMVPNGVDVELFRPALPTWANSSSEKARNSQDSVRWV